MWTRVIGLTKILTAPGVGRALELKWACRTLGWHWHALITPVKSNEIQVYVARVLSRGKSDKNELTFAIDGVTETIKSSRILEQQPSLKEVVETGMEYDRLINTA